MIFQDEIVARSMSKAGQVYFPPSVLKYDDTRVRRDFFVPSVYEYRVHRPKLKYLRVDVDSNGLTLPYDAKKVVSLRSYYDYFVGPVSKDVLPKTHYEVRDGRLYADPGDYYVEYQADYTITDRVSGQRITTLSNETYLSFELYGEIITDSLVIYYGSDTATTSDNGTITGNNITSGAYDPSTWIVTINFTEAVASNITIDFTSKNPVVLELDMNNIFFFQLFGARLLSSFGSAKAIARLEDLPFDITVDELLSYGRELESQWREDLERNQSWWVW